MSTWHHLVKSTFAALLVLSALALVLATASAMFAAFVETTELGVGGTFLFVLLATYVFGAVPALVVGAPMYAWLWTTGRASPRAALVLGAFLGLPGLCFSTTFGLGVSAVAAVFALATHFVCQAWADARPVALARSKGQ